MRAKKWSRKKVIVDGKEEDLVGTNEVEQQHSQLMKEVQKNSEFANNLTTNPINGKEKENQRTTIIESAATEETIVDLSIRKASGGVSTQGTIADLSTQKASGGVSTEETIVDHSIRKAAGGVSTQGTIDDLSIRKASGGVSTEETIVDHSIRKVAGGVSTQGIIDDLSIRKASGGVSTEETVVDHSIRKAAGGASTQGTIDDLSIRKAAGGVSTQGTIVNLSTENTFNSRSIPNGITSENENPESLLFEDINVTNNNRTLSRNSQGKKRSLEDNSDSSENQKPSYSYNDTSDAELMKWKKKCIDLEAKVKVFEEDYMPRPKDANTIQYFIDSGNTLRGVQRDEPVSDNGSLMEVLDIIGINTSDLEMLKEKTATALARSLIRYKYPNPNPNEGFLQADKSVVKAIIKYVRYRHPYGTTSDTALRRAMNNHFSSFTYNKKPK